MLFDHKFSPLFDADGDIGGNLDGVTPEKTFTKAEVDEMVNKAVGDRLGREGFYDMRGIVEELQSFGYQGTPKEIRDAIKTQKEEVARQSELEELQKQAKTEGTSPELLAEMREVKKELAEIKGERQTKKQAEEAKQQQEENWNKQVKEFGEEHSDVDLKTLNADEDFIEYASGRAGTLKTLYEGYVKLTSKLKEKTADEVTAKYKAKERGSTGSGKGGNQEGGDYGLTDRQKNLAKKSNMSFKKYAEYLKDAD